MLRDSYGYTRIYLAVGYTDLRSGINGLARKIKEQFNLDPFERNVLFLFCGRKPDKIKGLLWEGDGFLMLYKRLEDGRFLWPKDANEARRITQEQFEWLMRGHHIEGSIRESVPKRLF